MFYVRQNYYAKNGKEVEGASHQVIKCILCVVDLVNVLNPTNKKGNGLKRYYKTWYNYFLKKHVDANHSIIVKKIEEEVEILITKNVERKLVKKRPNVLANVISIFLL
jgi:flagellin-specific chaperone FliS